MVGSKFVISNNVSSYAQFRLTFFFLSSPHGCLHDDDDNDVVLDYREKYNTYNDMYDAYTNEISERKNQMPENHGLSTDA